MVKEMSNSKKEIKPILNITLIPCERVEEVNDKKSFIGIFDEIRVDKDMNSKFSVVIAYDILVADDKLKKTPVFEMQLSIDFIRTVDGQSGQKSLTIKKFELPPDEEDSEVKTKSMLCAGDSKGLIGLSGYYVFDISTVFIGEGNYQFALRGKNKTDDLIVTSKSKMPILAQKPFTVVRQS